MVIEKLDTDSEEETVKARKPIYVFLKSYQKARNLNKLGDLYFVSKRRKYACLYIDEASEAEIVRQLMAKDFVTSVSAGKMKELTEDFSRAFWEGKD